MMRLNTVAKCCGEEKRYRFAISATETDSSLRSLAAAFTRWSRRNACGGNPVARLNASLNATVESAARRDMASI